MKTLLYIGSFVYLVFISSHPIEEYCIIALVSSLAREMFFIHKVYKNGLDYYIGPKPKEEEEDKIEQEQDKIEQEQDKIEQEEQEHEQEPKPKKEEEEEEEEEDNIEQEQDKIAKNWLEIKYGRYIFYASAAPYFFVYVYSVYVRLEIIIELIKRL
jgi:ABC-type siderophore export system fused ATPase/permease subunit